MRVLFSAVATAFLLIMTMPAQAFKCYITLMKSECWKKHNVSFRVMDNLTEENILQNIQLNKDKLWVRKEFTCKAAQGLVPKVRFSPHVWESEKNSEFSTKRVWFLPLKIDENVEAWNVPICFPTDFSSVPTLPDAQDECDCSKTKTLVTPLPKPPRPF